MSLPLTCLAGLLAVAAEGPVCRDEKLDWWSGAGLPAGEPTPVDMYVQNAGRETLYLEGRIGQGVHFEILDGRDRLRVQRKLELRETTFCPTWCPASGPPAELDCGRSLPTFTPLAPGAILRIPWSGEEAPQVSRRCGEAPARPCRLRRATASGRYELRVCAHRAVTGGRRSADGRLQGAASVGPPRCQSVPFDHGRARRVELSLR